ncbi:MAG: hypothetical protein F6K32_13530 [Desertifilum sp. SIO1I2]|nr:hypothetical protein [Desertifilum sp. SIO1I2]
MDKTISFEENQAMLKWLNRNRKQLFELYRGEYVAYTKERLLAHHEQIEEVLKRAEESGETYAIYLVPRSTQHIQFLSFSYFRSVVRQEWFPNYQIKLKNEDKELSLAMLVDSGAELSLIPLRVGQALGLSLAKAEAPLIAETIVGRVEYVTRNLEMIVDGYSFSAPVAWLQSPTDVEQLLLGREVVFDRFNIEFRQAEETITFSWREDS